MILNKSIVVLALLTAGTFVGMCRVPASAAGPSSYAVCANSFIDACKAKGGGADAELGCVAENVDQCEDCALYEGGIKIKSLLPRTLTDEHRCPGWLDGTEGRKFAAQFKPITISGSKPVTRTTRCFGTTDTNYTTPEQVVICVDTSKECNAALDHYYDFSKATFGCAVKNQPCPTTEEYEAAQPPQYCWPTEYMTRSQASISLSGDRPAWDALRQKVVK